eukprot:12929716-Prorocentrum_lima.AAC.1
MLLENCEEKVSFNISSSTFYVINVRGDEAYQLWMESTMGAGHELCALFKLSPDLLVSDSLL